MATMPHEKLTDKSSSVAFPCDRAGVNLARLKTTVPCRQLKAFLSKNRKTFPRQGKRIVYLAALITLLGSIARGCSSYPLQAKPLTTQAHRPAVENRVGGHPYTQSHKERRRNIHV